MGKGRVRIPHDLIKQALNFPIDWEIEDISESLSEYGNRQNGESMMLISGSDFPETNNRGDAEDVRLICHKQQEITYEVEKI